MSLEKLTKNYLDVLTNLGEQPERDGLKGTPERAAKAMQFLCHGYNQSLDEIVNGALFDSDNDEMVIVKDIELYSLCEHHMLPFIGTFIASCPWEIAIAIRGSGRTTCTSIVHEQPPGTELLHQVVRPTHKSVLRSPPRIEPDAPYSLRTEDPNPCRAVCRTHRRRPIPS